MIVWLVFGIVVLIFTASDVSGFQLSSPGFSGVLVSFVGQVDLGRELGVSVLLVVMVAISRSWPPGSPTLAWAAVFSIVGPASARAHRARVRPGATT